VAQEQRRAFSNRDTIVLSRTLQRDALADAAVCGSMEEALAEAKVRGHEHVFLAGGTEVFRAGLGFAQLLYLTHVHSSMDGDAFFPADTEWRPLFPRLLRCVPHREGAHGFHICVYARQHCPQSQRPRQ
jgi:dihydrofolate reductase